MSGCSSQSVARLFAVALVGVLAACSGGSGGGGGGRPPQVVAVHDRPSGDHRPEQADPRRLPPRHPPAAAREHRDGLRRRSSSRWTRTVRWTSEESRPSADFRRLRPRNTGTRLPSSGVPIPRRTTDTDGRTRATSWSRWTSSVPTAKRRLCASKTILNSNGSLMVPGIRSVKSALETQQRRSGLSLLT